MEQQIVVYKYNDQEIEFSMDRNVMVNATEMAKIFNKEIKDFMRNADTKRFIKECHLDASHSGFEVRRMA